MNDRYLLFPLLLILLLTGGPAVAQNPQSKDMTQITEPGLAHTVYFWLQEGLTDEDRKSFEAGMRSLEKAPSVRRIFLGTPGGTPSRGVVDNTFDYSLVLWFDDVAGHDAYQVSDIHLQFVEDHEDKFREVKVFDNQSLQ